MLGPGVGRRTTEGDILRSLIGRLHRGNWTHKNREGRNLARKRAEQARMAGASSHWQQVSVATSYDEQAHASTLLKSRSFPIGSRIPSLLGQFQHRLQPPNQRISTSDLLALAWTQSAVRHTCALSGKLALAP
jgi:hypothetical protein